jgi:hypothetical protein
MFNASTTPLTHSANSQLNAVQKHQICSDKPDSTTLCATEALSPEMATLCSAETRHPSTFSATQPSHLHPYISKHAYTSGSHNSMAHKAAGCHNTIPRTTKADKVCVLQTWQYLSTPGWITCDRKSEIKPCLNLWGKKDTERFTLCLSSFDKEKTPFAE